jgi:hypothetical protein
LVHDAGLREDVLETIDERHEAVAEGVRVLRGARHGDALGVWGGWRGVRSRWGAFARACAGGRAGGRASRAWQCRRACRSFRPPVAFFFRDS